MREESGRKERERDMLPASTGSAVLISQGLVAEQGSMVASHMAFFLSSHEGYQHPSQLGTISCASVEAAGDQGSYHLLGGSSRLGSFPMQRSSASWPWGEEEECLGNKRVSGGDHQKYYCGKERDISRDSSSVGKKSSSLAVAAIRMKKVKARRKVREPRFCFKTMSEVDVLDDGYKWRKYGQKVVKNTQHPRSYYRCKQDNCRVKKRVERLAEDPRMVITTYEGRHVHSPSRDEDDDQPPSNTSFLW